MRKRHLKGNVMSVYEIRVKGHLDSRWSAWFEGLTITNLPYGEALLSGTIADQAALHGVLMKVRDLGLPLLAVNQAPPEGADEAEREADAS
jgi:hypothetical protein